MVFIVLFSSRSHKYFLHYDHPVKPQIFQTEHQFELAFIWGVTRFSWSISNLKYIIFLFFFPVLFVSGIHIGISESPSQFSWSTFETSGNNTARNWHELYYFCANNAAIYCLLFLLSLVSYFSSKHFVLF